ncbi:flagellar biosynthesis anti-sigma factor FlgM [Paraburkholderia sp. MMS20-SJTR3]|uniref:Negative regulator of flagellin synthesis n=1 Tax=Paraburkholderia sejongensis TaxID=2886946 RepID=A0ABS8JZY6_9BURK|nr:flagellar biosynthesis anti-sigma factor FlgM [Paraburkholderia sp. MMS20-SJTR3]MCC8395456.1 flagellar biosynthesis anti-sigma factor FlgM [Paraburkholderia sp. MMS20-SJTR3]
MKIETGNNTYAVFQNGAPRATNPGDENSSVGAAAPVSAAGAQSQTVELSATSSLRASSESDIDVAAVESIKAALRDGSYRIDSAKIADGMLSSARELLQTRSR